MCTRHPQLIPDSEMRDARVHAAVRRRHGNQPHDMTAQVWRPGCFGQGGSRYRDRVSTSISLIAEVGPEPGAKQLSSNLPAFKNHAFPPNPVLGAGGKKEIENTVMCMRFEVQESCFHPLLYHPDSPRVTDFCTLICDMGKILPSPYPSGKLRSPSWFFPGL